jgi:hypothetical protein
VSMNPEIQSGATTNFAAASSANWFAAPAFTRAFEVGAVRVELGGDSMESADLGPQLAPFAVSGGDADIRIDIEWRDSLAPCERPELFHSGSLWSAYAEGDGYQFDFTTEHLGRQPYKRLLTDASFQNARIILNRQCFSSGEPRALEYPLDELLISHYLSVSAGTGVLARTTAARGLELHACGMAHQDTGESFLFVGHSGGGKSTTARLWTQQTRVEVLSDDRIILRQKRGQFHMYGTPWHGEAQYASPCHVPVPRIFLLEHGVQNRIERIPTSAAVGELLARSFLPFYQARFVDSVLALLEELVQRVPCYRYQFVPDGNAVEKILGFRD